MEGFIVKNNGEVFDGLINYTPGNKIPSRCIFKRFDIAVEITYNADQVAAFGYRNGSRYESFLTEGKKTFAKVLVKGYLTLYLKGSAYYLSRNNSQPVRIADGPVSWNEEYPQREFKSPEELLRFLSAGKTEIKDNLDLKNDLIPVVAAINRESGRSFQVYNPDLSQTESKRQFSQSRADNNKLGLLCGLNIYSLSITPNKQIFFPDPESEKALMFGLTYERVISMSTDRWSFRTDLIYLRQTFYSSQAGKAYSGRYARDDAFFEFSAIKFPLLLQYSFKGLRYIPYLNGGIACMYIFKNKYLHINEEKVYPKDIYISEKNDMVFSALEPGGSLGAGVKMSVMNDYSLSLESRLEIGSGIFNRKYPSLNAFKQHSFQPSLILRLNF
jgi:hypothetical protein